MPHVAGSSAGPSVPSEADMPYLERSSRLPKSRKKEQYLAMLGTNKSRAEREAMPRCSMGRVCLLGPTETGKAARPKYSSLVSGLVCCIQGPTYSCTYSLPGWSRPGGGGKPMPKVTTPATRSGCLPARSNTWLAPYECPSSTTLLHSCSSKHQWGWGRWMCIHLLHLCSISRRREPLTTIERLAGSARVPQQHHLAALLQAPVCDLWWIFGLAVMEGKTL